MEISSRSKANWKYAIVQNIVSKQITLSFYSNVTKILIWTNWIKLYMYTKKCTSKQNMCVQSLQIF